LDGRTRAARQHSQKLHYEATQAALLLISLIPCPR
jgi:hypothetical protein